MHVKLAVVRLSETLKRFLVAGPRGCDELPFDRLSGPGGNLGHGAECTDHLLDICAGDLRIETVWNSGGRALGQHDAGSAMMVV